MTSAQRAKPRPTAERSVWWLVGALLTATAFLLYIVAALRGEETERGLIVAPILLIAAVPWLSRLRERETRFDLAGIMFAAIGAKLCAIYARFWMVDSLYNGVGDSSQYDAYGRLFAPEFRAFDFGVDAGAQVPGTGFLRILTGVVYAIFGTDRFTGFMIFGFMGFIGCWFFYRAFTSAVPDGDHKRYAYLVFFWPSVIFWPSAIGKEAWMLLSLGLVSWGAANIYQRKAHGFPLVALGVLGAAMPRPHIAIVVLAAFGVGIVTASLFGAGAGERKASAATKIVGVLFLVIAGAVLAPKVATFLQIDDVGGSGFADTLEDVNQRTAQGGSGFTAPEINSPLDYPWALITVLFRPFPWEVNSAATAISAVEGISLLVLMVASGRKLARLPGELIRNAYVGYAAAFTFMFVYVFAFIANFGILARQRTQLLPFLFVLIALPVPAAKLARRVSNAPGRYAAEPGTQTPKPSQPRQAPFPTIAPPRGS